MVVPAFRLRHQSFRTDAAEIPVCLKENRPKPRPEIIFNNFCLIRTRPLHFCCFSVCKSFPVMHLYIGYSLNSAQNYMCLRLVKR